MSLDILLLLYLFILARYYRPIKKFYQQAEHFKIVDSIFIRENAGQGKSAFQHFCAVAFMTNLIHFQPMLHF